MEGKRKREALKKSVCACLTIEEGDREGGESDRQMALQGRLGGSEYAEGVRQVNTNFSTTHH